MLVLRATDWACSFVGARFELKVLFPQAEDVWKLVWEAILVLILVLRVSVEEQAIASAFCLVSSPPYLPLHPVKAVLLYKALKHNTLALTDRRTRGGVPADAQPCAGSAAWISYECPVWGFLRAFFFGCNPATNQIGPQKVLVQPIP